MKFSCLFTPCDYLEITKTSLSVIDRTGATISQEFPEAVIQEVVETLSTIDVGEDNKDNIVKIGETIEISAMFHGSEFIIHLELTDPDVEIGCSSIQIELVGEHRGQQELAIALKHL